MSHMIDQSAGRDAIAFVGEVPWHGLGRQLTAGASIEQWTQEAGLGFTVERAPVMFRDAAGMPCTSRAATCCIAATRRAASAS